MLTDAIVSTGAFLTVSGDAFDDDDGSQHEISLDALATNGIILGTAPRRAEPNAAVRRDALASMLMRGTDFAIEYGGMRSPYADDFRVASMTADQVVDRHDDTDAVGQALLWTQPQGDLVCFEIGTEHVGHEGQDHPESGAYLAAAAPGEPGKIVVELPPPSAANDVPPEFDAWSAGCVHADRQVIEQMVAEPGRVYVGVATFEDGEVLRGQLVAPVAGA